ncbi:MAG: MBL fold metallo-hydrolase [Deltaproteobacteria bacterium]|nr:MBL fold metallo-hydrolase [Deltaproteobacteria bacterium]
MNIVFLGTNGWFDSGTGNTVCILVETQEQYLILDAGNGLHKIDRFIKTAKPIILFLSHLHLDHVVGLHIMNKFSFSQGIDAYGPPGTQKHLRTLIRQPFTANLQALNTPLRIHDLGSDPPPPFLLAWKKLVHVSPCYGYRFQLEDKVLSYCTDTGPCRNLSLLARKADLLITECAYKGNENYKWPHLNPLLAAEVAREAGARKLALIHFDASLYTTLEDRREAQRRARGIFKNTVAVRDDQEIVL